MFSNKNARLEQLALERNNLAQQARPADAENLQFSPRLFTLARSDLPKPTIQTHSRYPNEHLPHVFPGGALKFFKISSKPGEHIKAPATIFRLPREREGMIQAEMRCKAICSYIFYYNNF